MGLDSIFPTNDWGSFFQEEKSKAYFKALEQFLLKAYSEKVIYPKWGHIFQAFELCSLAKVKVVILGQDPYHQPHQAHGLAFSVLEATKLPPSLKNIFQELESNIGVPISTQGNLTKWAQQGVLLLNSTLTVEKSQPMSHQGKGWEMFSKTVLQHLQTKTKIVYLLWGKHAQNQKKWIDANRNLVLETSHPSPLSAYRGFFGCGHFSKANAYLTKNHGKPINWSLKNS